MKINDINAAITEAERFIERAAALRSTLALDDERVKASLAKDPNSWDCHYNFPKESGSVLRASMDLTRALAKMRGAK